MENQSLRRRGAGPQFPDLGALAPPPGRPREAAQAIGTRPGPALPCFRRRAKHPHHRKLPPGRGELVAAAAAAQRLVALHPAPHPPSPARGLRRAPPPAPALPAAGSRVPGRWGGGSPNADFPARRRDTDSLPPPFLQVPGAALESLILE